MRSAFLFPLVLPLLGSSFACVASTPEKPAPVDGCVAPTGAPVEHSGTIAADETWKADAVHVVRGDLVVDARLSIEACAVVRMASGSKLAVGRPGATSPASIVAEGTASKPIRFDGLDGARWQQIRMTAPARGRFAHVTIEGGGGDGAESLAMIGDQTLPVDRDLFVDHVTIKGSLAPALRVDGAAGFAEGSRALTVTGTGDATSAVVVGEYALDSLPTGSYTGNAQDRILIWPGVVEGKAGLQVDATLHDRGVPYVVGTAPGLDDFTIGWGDDTFRQPVLTIQPGVKLLFLKGSGFRIEGGGDKGETATLKAVGTADKPIVFASALPSPKPGDWIGFRFNGKPASGTAMEHVRIEHSGADCACSLVTCTKGVESYEGAIIMWHPPKGSFLKNSVITNGAGHGVVQGWDGNDFDWKSTNTFQDLGGCRQTAPRQYDTSCPDVEPVCD